MIFTSHEAMERYRGHLKARATVIPGFLQVEYPLEWETSAVMCDSDVVRPYRMRRLAEAIVAAADELDAECDASFCRRHPGLAAGINMLMVDAEGILDAIEELTEESRRCRSPSTT